MAGDERFRIGSWEWNPAKELRADSCLIKILRFTPDFPASMDCHQTGKTYYPQRTNVLLGGFSSEYFPFSSARIVFTKIATPTEILVRPYWPNVHGYNKGESAGRAAGAVFTAGRDSVIPNQEMSLYFLAGKSRG